MCTVYLSVHVDVEKTHPSVCFCAASDMNKSRYFAVDICPFCAALPQARELPIPLFGQILKQHWATTMSFLCDASFPEDQQLARRPSIHYFQARNPRFLFPPKRFRQQSSFLSAPLCGSYRISATSYQRCWTWLRQVALAERVVAARKLFCQCSTKRLTVSLENSIKFLMDVFPAMRSHRSRNQVHSNKRSPVLRRIAG